MIVEVNFSGLTHRVLHKGQGSVDGVTNNCDPNEETERAEVYHSWLEEERAESFDIIMWNLKIMDSN